MAERKEKPALFKYEKTPPSLEDGVSFYCISNSGKPN